MATGYQPPCTNPVQASALLALHRALQALAPTGNAQVDVRAKRALTNMQCDARYGRGDMAAMPARAAAIVADPTTARDMFAF